MYSGHAWVRNSGHALGSCSDAEIVHAMMSSQDALVRWAMQVLSVTWQRGNAEMCKTEPLPEARLCQGLHKNVITTSRHSFGNKVQQNNPMNRGLATTPTPRSSARHSAGST